ncbi:MAG: HEAT repeat domain-containing protein [Cyanothece sp. SIO2G6]|nr:HEAT repeat domain-containing protein [Cyanothece sp. SIO2G6]
MTDYITSKQAVNSLSATPAQSLTLDIDLLIQSVSQQIDLLTFDSSDVDTLQQLAHGFADERESVHLRLIELFGEIGEDATPLLCQFMANHHNVRVRQACAQALARLGDPEAITPLVQALLTDHDPLIQSSVAGALARMGEEAVSALLRVMNCSSLSDAQKGQIAWALSCLGEDAASQIYAEIESGNPDVRCAVVGAIATLARNTASEQAVQLLESSLDDPVLAVRLEAASGLGQLSCHNATARLVPLLNDPEPEMRKTVALALGTLKDPKAFRALQALVSDPSEIVRPVVEWAIQQYKTSRQ